MWLEAHLVLNQWFKSVLLKYFAESTLEGMWVPKTVKSVNSPANSSVSSGTEAFRSLPNDVGCAWIRLSAAVVFIPWPSFRTTPLAFRRTPYAPHPVVCFVKRLTPGGGVGTPTPGLDRLGPIGCKKLTDISGAGTILLFLMSRERGEGFVFELKE